MGERNKRKNGAEDEKTSTANTLDQLLADRGGQRAKVRELNIQIEYPFGPLCGTLYDFEKKIWYTGVPCVDEDTAVQILNREAAKMYNSLFVFVNEEKGFMFDNVRYQEIKRDLFSLVETLIQRLNDINDGSYVVIDHATDELCDSET